MPSMLSILSRRPLMPELILLMLLWAPPVSAVGKHAQVDAWARDLGNLSVEQGLELLSLDVQIAGRRARLHCLLLGDWFRYMALRSAIRAHPMTPRLRYERVERTAEGALRAELILELKIAGGH